MGVSMEELDASLVAITIGGVKANEAATQLRGVMTALLKPSDGMKQAFRQIGVDSGEAAIATWGFKGTLEQLQKTTDGSATAMATMFQNVRGLAGALRLAESGAQKYDEAMRKLSEVDQATLSKKFEEFTSTDAEKLTKELNKISNFFTVEFGANIVKSLEQIINLFGGGDGLVSVLRALSDQVGLATISLGSLGLILVGSAAHAKLAALEIGGLNSALLLLAGLPAAKALGEMLGDWISKKIAQPYDEIRRQTQQELDVRKQETEAAIRENERKNDEVIKGLRQYVAESNKLYLQDAENFKTAVKIEEQVIKMAFDRIMQSRQKMTQELFSAAEEAAKKAAEIPQQIAAIQQQIADRSFTNLTQRFDPYSQFTRFRDQAEKLASDAAKLQGAAKDAGEEKLADAAWKRADAYAKLAEQAAKQIGSYALHRQAEQMLLDLDNKRISALKQQMATQQQVAKEAEARAQQAEQHNLELEEMRKAIEEKLKTTAKDAEGGVSFKGKDELKKDLTDAEGMIEEFADKLRQYNKEDFIKNFLGDPKAFESLKREAERQLAGMDLKMIEVAPEAIAGMYDALQQSLDRMKLEVPVLARIEKFTGKEIVSNGLQEVLNDFEKQWNDITNRNIRAPQLNADMMAVKDQFDQARKAAGADRPTDKAKGDVQNILSELDQIRQKGVITDQDILKLKQDLQSIDFTHAFGAGTAAESFPFSQQLKNMIDALGKMRELQQQMRENATFKEGYKDSGEIQSINQQINALQNKKQQIQEATQKTQEEKGAADQVKGAIDNQTSSANGGIGAVAALAAAWSNVAQAAWDAAAAAVAASLASSSTSGEAEGAALGGLMRRFDRGGFAQRGTDTIPAMLSPGEFVVNSRATQRWYSQLVAMNAGLSPSRFAGGGQVTNAGIMGDVTVNVNGRSSHVKPPVK